MTGLVIGDTALTWTTFWAHCYFIINTNRWFRPNYHHVFLYAGGEAQMKLKTMLAMQESVGTDSFATAGGLVKRIILVTAGCELIGGLI